MYSRIVSIIFLGILFLASSLSVAESSCRYIFGSRLYYDIKALKRKNRESDFHPRFEDIAEERILQKRWNEEPDIPKLLKFLLPQDVHFIKRQLYQPGHATAVKLGEWGNEIIARAHYKHGERVYHTNVAFSVRALVDNKDSANHNWLVGKNAKAAILFLHGGGTKSTGFHVAGDIITHWSQYGVDVVSMDLPWHAQGHREFVNAETDIKIIGSFVKKYIPPNVPLFVVGHSWGSVFAEQLMRMTDRPLEEFSFHNNLMGVAMLSTAVDAAPGKSRQEKYTAYFKRLKESKKRSHTEAPEGELHIFENIVRDGKTSPLGGAYSMNVISYLDQTTPRHQGREFIPGLMVVGTKDSLVYFGFEDLYEVYKELVNVETHYLNKPMPHAPKGEIHGVGHDVFSTLDPKTREPIVNVLLKNFIAKQLAFSALKTNVVREIHLSSNELLKDTAIDTVKGLKSFDALKDFLETDLAQKVLDSEVLDNVYLDNVYNEYINQSASSLKKQRPVIPDFIRLMQLTANELSFREFIPDFVYYEEKVTATYISYKREKTHDQARKILEVLDNYNTPPRRIYHVLQEVLNANNKAGLSSLRTEMEFITVEIFREDGAFKINNKKLERALIALKEEIEKLIDSNLSSGKTLSDIKQQAKQILEEYGAFFASVNRNSASKKISGLTDSIINASNLNEVRRIIAPSQLPEPILKKVIVLMEEYFIIQRLISFDYAPALDSFRTLNMPYKHRRKALDIIAQLSTVIKNIRESNAEYLEAIKERDRIRKEHNELFDKVKQNIKLLKDIFKNSNYRPPAVLLEAHNRSAEELKAVVKAQEAMDKALDEVFREGEDLQDAQITEMLEQRRDSIDKFVDLYRQYIRNRQILTEELIAAGERGDMGIEFKNIVTSLYGYGSRGRTSIIGPGNIYSSLKSVVVDLAKAEVKVYYFQKLRRENKVEYNGLMNDLERIIAKHRPSEKKELALVTDAANLFNVTEYPLLELLNGKHGTIQLDSSNREAVVRYIDNNKYKGVFSEAVNHWKSLQSRVPPLLPTASD